MSSSSSGPGYSLGSQSGRSVLAFDIDQSGIYELSADILKETMGHG